ncbi:enoyl-CoA hydratase/isomerase family protein, partial [Chloroflexota bacterium]
MQYKAILFNVSDGVAKITLNDPGTGNSINRDMTLDLMNVALYCSEEPRIKSILITGAGSALCTGGNLKVFASQGKNLPYYLKETTT